MIRLIITDLDGSLLTDLKELPGDFWRIEKLMAEKGIYLAIASGRPYHNLALEFDRIHDRTYFLSDNGSYIRFQDQELLISPLDRKGVNDMVQTCRPLHQVFPVLCGKEKAYMENNDESLLKIALQYYQHYEIVPDLTQVEAEILKISFCDLIDAETNAYPHFALYEPHYKVAVSGKSWVDITAMDANKGRATTFLQQKLGVSWEETAVFGDYLNDLEMMQAARFSYAMKNAHPQILKTANYVTAFDNNHGGVTKTILELLKIQ